MMDEKQATIEKNEKYICSRFGCNELSSLDRFPQYFEIETVHMCNAKCRMCTIETWPRRSSIMDQKLWDKMVGEFTAYTDTIKTITLCRDGEPLMDKKLEAKIQDLKEIGVKNVVFSTNASLLHEKRAASLIKSGLDEIMFSVDGFSKEVFENIRQGLDFDQVKNNILNFFKIRDELNSPIKVRLRMIVQDLNVDEYDQWLQYWSPKVGKDDMVYGRPIHSWGNQIDVSKFKTGNVEKKAPLCAALWSTMVIHSDGTVPMCSVDYANKNLMGDITENSIAEIWQSEHLSKLRKIHIEGDGETVDMCRGCYLWDPETLYK